MPAVRGTTEVILVVADPVAQVKAPQALNLVFARAGIDAVAVPARVSAERLGPFVREAMAVGNVRGLLVSIPHKTPLMAVLDRFDAAASAAGAVNAVRRAADGALEGALFDGLGFVAALRHHGVPVAGKRVLLLGGGGAGLGIASALADCGLGGLSVFDMQPSRATALAQRVGAQARFAVTAVPTNDARDHDVVIQATPMGLRTTDPLPLDPACLRSDATVVDILMTRHLTPLERACRERGIAVYSGHEMMVQQIPAYLDYFGFAAPASALREPDDRTLQAVRFGVLEDRACG